MSGRKHWRTLIAGCGLIALVNALVLGGVAYNRSGEPDSLLRLSERELPPKNGRWLKFESGGMILTLAWRVLPAKGSDDFYGSWATIGGSPVWLDTQKMRSLGFEVTEPSTITPAAIRRQRSRDVLLVLEFDGPAYQQALNLARERYAEESRLLAANPGKQEFVRRRDDAQKRLQREETLNSRLFAVDAGLDAATLRAQYPDRTRYLIAKGRVYAQWHHDQSQPTLSGRIGRLAISEINIPVELQPTVAAHHPFNPTPPFQATIAIGQRLEPWLREIALGNEMR
ncbi:MAG TPA: DUF4824 family protein [Accumulibacter sp.]|nr:DUF4824 family protein [Accumulibacter sp.]HMW18523.1 DUF4824 family protein [Accumulibacter sp.]HMX22862.1 DUF4824 family protein [Accumulibacter sp.]HMY07732.1 DUF4824 family protein [Accumulibacter sp.]HNC17012.1 DUF4824 family protein [Accumulibacter sp.]